MSSYASYVSLTTPSAARITLRLRIDASIAS
jgi:hypothetical protein